MPTKYYGLIGYPLGHSFSADFFCELFVRQGVDAQYTPYELLSIDELPELLTRVPLSGLNVTSPYKREVLRYASELSSEVKAIGAANVLQIERDSTGNIQRIRAHNTDIVGFRDTIRGRFDRGSLALVLGTGGAAEAVRYALCTLGLRVLLVSRTPRDLDCISYSAVERYLPQAVLLVNATPVGMNPTECICLPYHLLTEQHLCYDLIYNPSITPFLAEAMKYGADTINGLAMLHGQALEAWRIWSESSLDL